MHIRPWEARLPIPPTRLPRPASHPPAISRELRRTKVLDPDPVLNEGWINQGLVINLDLDPLIKNPLATDI